MANLDDVIGDSARTRLELRAGELYLVVTGAGMVYLFVKVISNFVSPSLTLQHYKLECLSREY